MPTTTTDEPTRVATLVALARFAGAALAAGCRDAGALGLLTPPTRP